MKVYYAHPMSWYGTDREKDDVTIILANTPLHTEVVNPNSPEHKEVVDSIRKDTPVGQPIEAIMQYFLGLVRGCDALAYRTFDDGRMGAGVALELFTAAVRGQQIFRLMDFGSRVFEEHGLQAAFGPRLLTIEQTRERLSRGLM